MRTQGVITGPRSSLVAGVASHCLEPNHHSCTDGAIMNRAFSLFLAVTTTAACANSKADRESLAPEAASRAVDSAKGCRAGFSLCSFNVDTNSTLCCNNATQVCNHEEGFCMEKPPVIKEGDLALHAVVLSILYAPPGIGSSVTYANGTTMGTSLDFASSTQHDDSVEFNLGFKGGSGGPGSGPLDLSGSQTAG